MYRISRIGAGIAALALALCQVSRVQASPLFELVGSAFGSGGFNARTTGASAASTYFNPALLPQAKQGFEIGWFFLNDNISITLDARSKANDVPVSAVSNFGQGARPSIPTDWLQHGCDPMMGGTCATKLKPVPRQSQGSSGNSSVYQTLGLVSRIWEDKLVMGLYAMVPYGSFTQAHSYFVDEREQFFSNSLHPEMYGDRLTPVSLAFGAGSRFTKWLSFGLTFTLGLKNKADATVYVPDSAKLADTLQLSTKVDVAASVSPHFGLLIEPIEPLDISITVHTPQKMEIDTAFSTYLPNGDLQRAERPATHAWMPWTLGLGANYDVYKSEKNKFAVVATITYERWSKYLNRQTEHPTKDYEWSDTFAGNFGGRYTYDQKMTLFLDGTYKPTPVPVQTGRTNYVDNNRYGFTGGISYDYPIDKWKIALRFGAQAQAQFLPRRHQTKFDPTSPAIASKKYSQLVVDEWADDTKDVATGQTIAAAKGLQTNNPGWPGFASEGVILGGALNLGFMY
jgi:long-chain fatty acid transport protein